jgi:hypothetical protein
MIRCSLGPWTLRRRMKQIGLVCKRPRYSYSEKDPHRAQKKAAIVRKLKRRPLKTMLLFEDETILRLLPELRGSWSSRGEQTRVPITGQNDRCVLFGTLNLRTGHRVAA